MSKKFYTFFVALIGREGSTGRETANFFVQHLAKKKILEGIWRKLVLINYLLSSSK
jgi:hypothetical protein